MPVNSSDQQTHRTWIMIVAMAAILAVSIWAGNRGVTESGKTNVVCTFLPVYVFALNVIGDDADFNVQQLVPQNVGCPHSYALRTADVQKVDNADVILANGLGSEHFLEKVLAQNTRATVLEISDNCDLLPAATEEGDDHAHDHEHGHESGEPAVNPHVWVSPIEAQKQVRTLADKLARHFPDKAAQFEANADAYIKRLAVLADEYKRAAKRFRERDIITFHPAFNYLARDLDLNVVTTLTTVPGYEPTSGELNRTIETIRRHNVHVLFVEPAYRDSNRLANAIRGETNVRIYSLNPFNMLDRKPTADSYERVMRENLETLKEALGVSEQTP